MHPPTDTTDPYQGFLVKVVGASPRWLSENEFIRAGLFDAARVVVVQRSALRIQVDAVAITLAPMFRAVDSLDHATHRLLIDSRAAPGQNDPDFEKIFNRFRTRLLSGWLRSAVLVNTIPGHLQLQRHQREGLDAEVFMDPDKAIDWLLRPIRPLR
jgi:hypothetical protein